MPKVLKITSVQCLCDISRKNWAVKLMFCMLINMNVFYKLMILVFLIGLTRHVQSTWLNLQYLWHLRKEVKNEVRDFTALIGSNTALPLTLFRSQYRIHTKPFIHFINCFYNITSLSLFQVTVGPCKLACLFFMSDFMMVQDIKPKFLRLVLLLFSR